MKNPFLKGSVLLGDRQEQMFEKIREWKPAPRTDPPKKHDFPLLLWRSGSQSGWQIWEDERQADSQLKDSDERYAWFSLPKV